MDDFERFVAEHCDQLVRTAYLITWDAGEAEDLTQECLLAIARRWPRVRRMAHPGAYARRILVNLALDGARGRARRRGELDLAPALAELEATQPAALQSSVGATPPRRPVHVAASLADEHQVVFGHELTTSGELR